MRTQMTGLVSSSRIVVIAVAAVSLAACSNVQTRTDPTLYEDLGAQTGIETIVNEMLRAIATDNRVAAVFASSNLPRLRRLLEEQFCEISDGPCTYTGFSMAESHRGMTVTESEFNAVVESLVIAMEGQSIPVPVQNRLLARLAPLQPQIVYR